ncbi:DNA-binding transcriptional MerR regulator [Roseiarcus fermentans]|uniref:DNA-binding transcriptional MerR regulator n=1 Tax=Roseiarcus fermentans TaxID=1473586 RepID=A0A366FS53_9HYPH|nr:MerR family transcriptional regulator [Roseiarcus fermentans]RBP16565.1 DNA-binding transcriptional MerR regulator [Roseiarcus fermentans]
MSRLSSLGHSPIALARATERKPPVKPAAEQDEMTISQMSRAYGVSLRTLRFYEDRGLIAPRREGNARFYRPADRTRVEMILRGKKLGFTLAEIGDLIGGGRGATDTPDFEQRLQPQQIANQIGHLERQREEIENAIARLKATHMRRVQEAAA